MSGLPDHKFIGNQRYKLTVLKVTKTFPNGTPRNFERIPEQGTTHIEGGEWFVTAYVPECVLDSNQVSFRRDDEPPTKGGT